MSDGSRDGSGTGDRPGPAPGGGADPWWASGDPQAADGDDPQAVDGDDPLAAHRAARRGADAGTDHEGDPADTGDPFDALADAARSLRDGLASAEHRADNAHRHGNVEACEVCPVCTLIRVLGEARPELVDHLGEAARHLTLAAKAVVDAEAARYDDELERIELDDE